MKPNYLVLGVLVAILSVGSGFCQSAITELAKIEVLLSAKEP